MMDRRQFLAMLGAMLGPSAGEPQQRIPAGAPLSGGLTETGKLLVPYWYSFYAPEGGQCEALVAEREFLARSIYLMSDAPISYRLVCGALLLLPELQWYGDDRPFRLMPELLVNPGEPIHIKVKPETVPWGGAVAGVQMYDASELPSFEFDTAEEEGEV